MQPTFGDHLMITFNLPLVKPKIETTYKRDWRKYNSINLNLILSHEKWEISEDNVQNCWNDFENILIRIVDKLAPMTEFSNNSVKHNPPPALIKRKINSRRRALKQFKNSPTVALKSKIKTLNTEIKNFFFSQKKLAVRRDITPGSTLSLWSALFFKLSQV